MAQIYDWGFSDTPVKDPETLAALDNAPQPPPVDYSSANQALNYGARNQPDYVTPDASGNTWDSATQSWYDPTSGQHWNPATGWTSGSGYQEPQNTYNIQPPGAELGYSPAYGSGEMAGPIPAFQAPPAESGYSPTPASDYYPTAYNYFPEYDAYGNLLDPNSMLAQLRNEQRSLYYQGMPTDGSTPTGATLRPPTPQEAAHWDETMAAGKAARDQARDLGFFESLNQGDFLHAGLKGLGDVTGLAQDVGNAVAGGYLNLGAGMASGASGGRTGPAPDITSYQKNLETGNQAIQSIDNPYLRTAVETGLNPLSYIGGLGGVAVNLGLNEANVALSQYGDHIPGWNKLSPDQQQAIILAVTPFILKGGEKAWDSGVVQDAIGAAKRGAVSATKSIGEAYANSPLSSELGAIGDPGEMAKLRAAERGQPPPDIPRGSGDRTDNFDPDFLSASQKILDAAKQEQAIRRSGTAAAEIRAGRATQLGNVSQTLAEGQAMGLSPDEIIAQGRGASRVGALRQTVARPLDLTPEELQAVQSDIIRGINEGSLPTTDFYRLAPGGALDKLVNGGGLQPKELQWVRQYFGDDVANAAEQRVPISAIAQPTPEDFAKSAAIDPQVKKLEATAIAQDRLAEQLRADGYEQNNPRMLAAAQEAKARADEARAQADLKEQGIAAKASAKATADQTKAQATASQSSNAEEFKARMEAEKAANKAKLEELQKGATPTKADLAASSAIDPQVRELEATATAQDRLARQLDQAAKDSNDPRQARAADAARVRAQRARDAADKLEQENASKASQRAVAAQEKESAQANQQANKATLDERLKADKSDPNLQMLEERAKAKLGENPNAPTGPTSALNQKAVQVIDDWKAENNDILGDTANTARWTLDMANRTLALRAALEATGVETNVARQIAEIMAERELKLRYPGEAPANVVAVLDSISKRVAPRGRDWLNFLVGGPIRQIATLGPGHIGLHGFLTGLTDLPKFWEGIKAMGRAYKDPESVRVASVARRLELESIQPGLSDTMSKSRLRVFGNVASGDLTETILNHIPGVRQIVNRSNAAYDAATQEWRYQWARQMLEIEKAAKGVISDEAAKSIAAKANHLTFTTSRMRSTNSLVDTVLFAPRMATAIASLPKDYFSSGAGGSAVRRVITQTMLETMGSMAAANLSQSNGRDLWGPGLGRSIPTNTDDFNKLIHDPRFLTVKVGDYKIKPMGPFDSYVRTALKEAGNIVANDPSAFGSDARDFLQTHLSPLMSIGVDAMVKKNYLGEPISIKQMVMDHMVPIATPELFEAGKELASGHLLNAGVLAGEFTTGLKESPITPSQGRDIQAIDKFGRKWTDLTPQEQNQLKAIKDSAAATYQPVSQSAKDAAVRRQADFTNIQQRQQAVDQKFAAPGTSRPADPTAGQNWRDQYHAVQLAQQAMYEKDQRDFPYTGDPSKDPTRQSLDERSQLIKANTVGDQVNWDAVDKWAADNPQKQKLIDAYFSDPNRPQTAPLTGMVGQYKDDSKAIGDAGFFDIKDPVWSQIAKGDPALANYPTYEAFTNAVADAVTHGAPPTPDQQTVIGKVLAKFPGVETYKKVTAVMEDKWVASHPNEAVLAYQWGYLQSPDKLQKAIISAVMAKGGQ